MCQDPLLCKLFFGSNDLYLFTENISYFERGSDSVTMAYIQFFLFQNITLHLDQLKNIYLQILQ